MNLVHAFPPSLFKILLNIITPSIPRSSKRSPSFKFLHQNHVRISHLPDTCCCACMILLDLINLTTFGEDYNLQSSLLYILSILCLLPLRPKYTYFLRTLFSTSLSLGFTLLGERPIFYTLHNNGNVIFLCVIIFTFFDSKRENKRLRSGW
jgi:hypothetical protein